MPNWRTNVDRASTMRASIVICGVWVSSERARSAICCRFAAMSLTISEFVRPSTSMWPFGDSMPSNLGFSSSADA